MNRKRKFDGKQHPSRTGQREAQFVEVMNKWREDAKKHDEAEQLENKSRELISNQEVKEAIKNDNTKKK